MRRLSTSITREELSELLDVPLDFVDALLDSGKVLCHVKGGQPRIPLAQLEEFFRHALMQVYAKEAGGGQAILPVLPDPEPLAAIEPAPMAVEEPSIPEPAPAEIARAPLPVPIPAPAVRVPQPEPHYAEQRIATRYVPLRQLGGIFGETKFFIMQLSATGMRIRHSEPLMPGDEAKLSFALLKPARSVVVRAKVVWTSMARSGKERFSISGLRIIEHQDRVAAAIDSLRAANELQPERRATSRRATDTMSVLSGVSDEEMALVTAAVQKFATDPVEASRWYSRARFALSDENVRRAAPDKPRDREEVLGIWEYLERQVEIEKIAGVVSWIRNASTAPQ